MVSHGYTRIYTNHYVYLKTFPDDKFVIILLYVYDMLIVGQDIKNINGLKKGLFGYFNMQDLGPA